MSPNTSLVHELDTNTYEGFEELLFMISDLDNIERPNEQVGAAQLDAWRKWKKNMIRGRDDIEARDNDLDKQTKLLPLHSR